MVAFVAVASAATLPGSPVGIVSKAILGQEAAAEVLRSESVVDPDKFHYAYETSNGINAQADGQLRQLAKPEEPALVHQGFYSYTAPDNTVIKVDYVADENGYQPSVSLKNSFIFLYIFFFGKLIFNVYFIRVPICQFHHQFQNKLLVHLNGSQLIHTLAHKHIEGVSNEIEIAGSINMKSKDLI